MEVKYAIKKGRHYSNKSFWPPYLFIGNSCFRWECKFSEKAWYRPDSYSFGYYNSDFDDINKLVGVCFGLNRAKGSVRVGWVPDFAQPGVINLCIYYYGETRKDIKFEQLCSINTTEAFTIVLHRINTVTRVVILQNEDIKATKAVDIDSSCSKWGYYHKPYHGGNLAAPNSYQVLIDRQYQEVGLIFNIY